MTADPFQTLADAVSAHSASHGESVALSFLDRGERIGDTLTYGALDMAARSVAACLVEAGLRGRPVLLPLPSSRDFICCFFGCLYAGAYAVPAPAMIGRRALDRIASILHDLGECGAILPTSLAKRAGPMPAHCRVIWSEDALGGSTGIAPHPVRPDDLAFIQYTSGSLGAPRGVAVTHRNIMANLAMIAGAFEVTRQDLVVSWLPLHHDMGLIGSVLAPLSWGGQCILMSPFDFMLKPIRWLRAIDTFGATISGAPNFGFDLCARVAEEGTANLDLSRWRLAFCGSEPIRPSSLHAFADRFQASNFATRALYPCYGLAEATLLVSAVKAGGGFHAQSANPSLVSCGAPVAGCRIAILPARNELEPEGRGEICVAGEHVTAGYWSREAGRAEIDPEKRVDIDGTTFMRTGDVGSLTDGELYVHGRSRDLIIVRGQKLHAEDVENTVLGWPHMPGLVAASAFAIDSRSGEALIVVCEVDDARAEPSSQRRHVEALRALVGEVHGVLPQAILLAPPRTIPRTSSGKIKRSACRDLYVRGVLAEA